MKKAYVFSEYRVPEDFIKFFFIVEKLSEADTVVVFIDDLRTALWISIGKIQESGKKFIYIGDNDLLEDLEGEKYRSWQEYRDKHTTTKQDNDEINFLKESLKCVCFALADSMAGFLQYNEKNEAEIILDHDKIIPYKNEYNVTIGCEGNTYVIKLKGKKSNVKPISRN